MNGPGLLHLYSYILVSTTGNSVENVSKINSNPRFSGLVISKHLSHKTFVCNSIDTNYIISQLFFADTRIIVICGPPFALQVADCAFVYSYWLIIYQLFTVFLMIWLTQIFKVVRTLTPEILSVVPSKIQLLCSP